MGTYPMEVVRTRMITQTPSTPPQLRIHGVAQGLRLIFRTEGLKGFYKGGWSGIIGAIPFEGVQFGCYEYLKHSSQAHQWPAFRWPQGKTELDGLDYFVCGSIAGAIAQTVAYPFDTVKKRLQTQTVGAFTMVESHAMVAPSARHSIRAGSSALSVGAPSGEYYRGMVDCFRKIIRDEGLLALYRGTIPNLVRIVPYAAVMFSTTYELSKKAIRLACESTMV
ncbi:hypothetical protein ATCC90586_001725 [Pythium insidiosum]|nr:hypothetical protein ATCC90586_001725 [Pythium insidiosum]